MKSNPLATEVALPNSSLHFASQGAILASNDENHRHGFLVEAHREFKRRVLSPDFPCLGAKAAFHEQSYGFAVYPELASVEATAGLYRDLFEFREHERKIDKQYSTFVAVFSGPVDIGEARFEELLWRQLRELHEADVVPWAAEVSSDPADPHFSFSFAGRAFYIVGMHANSSRKARRFPWPALVFNPHEQFVRLRADGKWKRMQRVIRAREVALQGSINPMLNDFGEQSEARQYSGRDVGDDWVAPFRPAGKCPFAHQAGNG